MTVCVNYISCNNNVQQISLSKKASQPDAITTQPNFNQVQFKGYNDKSSTTIRTKLANKEEQNAYNNVATLLSGENKKALNRLLKSGILLKNNSDDKSSVLDNLNKIASTQRADGLENKVILSNVIKTLDNPFTINQKLGDIPDSFKAKFLSSLLNNKEYDFKTMHEADTKLKDLASSTCPTACVEFNLASKHQAEFARMANDLTSPKLSTEKIVEFNNISKNLAEAVWLLNAFNTKYEVIDKDKVKITLKPDKDAITRAQLQTKHQDGLERNATDVLIQSTLMNLGSQSTYNSLVDERKGDFAVENTGLIEFEKTFIETIAENKNTTSMLYQQVDDNLTVTGYECDFQTTKQQLLDTLKRNQNVIIGITYFETDKEQPDPSRPTNAIAGGHEITIIGAKTDKNGETIFICQDSDDEINAPIEFSEKWLLPRLHHAGLPEDIAARTIKESKENWQITLENYKEMKKA